ncbi:MAG: CBS domain-containing protein [Acidobacteria bacterium]|nr:CBS domain-containing protein [Acidobacteriota bacterium]
MTENPIVCRVDNNLAEATELMWNVNCGALPVLDEEGKVVGMITDRDICIALGTRNERPSDVRVGDVIEWKLFSCSADDNIHDALTAMKSWKVRRLPVLNSAGKLEGILSLNDAAIRAARRQGDLTYPDVADTLKAICEHTPAEVRHAAA